MAILSRRCLQALISASTRFTTPIKLKDVVSRLNQPGKAALAAEWELIVLTGLANTLPVEHEVPSSTGGRNLDVRFPLDDGSVVADVIAVSDESYDKDNPTSALYEQFSGRIRKRGIKGKFGIGIGGAEPVLADSQNYPRKRLKLPRPEFFGTWIFDSAFESFLDLVVNAPGEIHRHNVNNNEASLEFVYSPGRDSHTLSHSPYYLPDDLTRNPIYKALTSKARQIKDVACETEGHLRGVVLCDAGCKAFRSGSAGPAHFTPAQVVQKFLTESKSVDFVCMVGVVQESRFSHWNRNLVFEATVFAARYREMQDAIEQTFQRALDTLPSPIRGGLQAAQVMKNERKTKRQYNDSYATGVTMSDRMLGMSIRALLDYAAGRLKRDEFENLAGIDAVEQLNRFLDAGLAVHSIEIQNAGMRRSKPVLTDGDFALIKFGEPDPAVSKFVEPAGKPHPARPFSDSGMK